MKIYLLYGFFLAVIYGIAIALYVWLVVNGFRYHESSLFAILMAVFIFFLSLLMHKMFKKIDKK